MILSQTCSYGLRAMLYLATHTTQQEPRLSIRTVADALQISYPFLAKIILTLTQAGLIHSTRGAGGGVCLARDAHEISPLDIIQVLDGSAALSRCVLGLSTCDETHPCPLHRKWSKLRPRIEDMLAGTNLHTFAREIKNGDLRLIDLEP